MANECFQQKVSLHRTGRVLSSNLSKKCPTVCFKKWNLGTSLVVPGLRNHLHNAGDMGEISDQRTKTPPVTGQLSLHASIRELAQHNYWARQLQLERSPHIAIKGLQATIKTQCSQKQIHKVFLIVILSPMFCSWN